MGHLIGVGHGHADHVSTESQSEENCHCSTGKLLGYVNQVHPRVCTQHGHKGP